MRALGVAFAALALAACSQAPSTRAQWQTLDGQPADPADVRAAGTRCREHVHTRAGPGTGRDTEWGLAMVDCLRGEGFVLVTHDPELAP